MKQSTFLWWCRIYAALTWGAILGLLARKSPETLLGIAAFGFFISVVITTAFATLPFNKE